MIRKLSIIFAVLIGTAFSKNSWECDSAGQMKCAQDNTCCRSRTSSFGWACFPLVEAVCCSDGVNVCPSGTICDLTAKTCRRNSLAFLQLPEIQAGNYTEPILALTPVDAVNFTVGFYEGIEIFNPVLANSTCIQESTKLVRTVINILDVLSHFNFENPAPQLKEILHLLENTVSIGEVAYPSCTDMGLQLKDLLTKVYSHVVNPKYLEHLGTHVIFNLSKVKEIYEAALKDTQDQVYFRAGKGFGELVKFVALWDL